MFRVFPNSANQPHEMMKIYQMVRKFPNGKKEDYTTVLVEVVYNFRIDFPENYFSI